MARPTTKPLVFEYAKCGTCRKALQWLATKRIDVERRPIVDAPPTRAELERWIPASGLPVKRWLNTSGQSYRALGKAKVDAASDVTLVKWLAADGKLIRRPVLVHGKTVLVGFREDAWESALG